MSNSDIQELKTPETSFNGNYHEGVPNLDNYSVRDDNDDTSSEEENQENQRPENSSLKSWFFKPKGESNVTSPAKKNAKDGRTNSSDSAISQGTPTNSRSGSPFRKSLRSFFKRENKKDPEITDSDKPVTEPDRNDEQPRQHRFWKPWRGHYSQNNDEQDDDENEVSRCEFGNKVKEDHGSVLKKDPSDLLTHEQKRERNMERLTQQLMDFSSSDEDVTNRSRDNDDEQTHDTRFIDGDVDNEADDSNYESSDSSASSSVERAKEVKEKMGPVFSPSTEESFSPKNNEISPLTPVDDVVDNPYKYVFEPAKSHSNASIAHDCSWIDKNSVAFDNFGRALKMLVSTLNSSSSLEGSLFTTSELSNEFLEKVQNHVESYEKVVQERNDMESTLKTVQNSFGDLRSEAEHKDQENIKLKAELELLKDKYSHMEKNFESLSEEAEILTDEVAHSKKDFFAAKDRERASNERTQEEISALKKQLEIKTKDLSQALSDLQDEKVKHNDIKVDHDAIKSKRKELQEKLGLLEHENKTVNSAFHSLEKEHDAMVAKFDFIESQYKSTKEDCDTIRAKHESMKTNYYSTKKQCESFKNEYESLKSRFDSIQNDYKTTIFDNEIMHEKNNILTTRLSDLVSSINRVENEGRDAKGVNQESFVNRMRRYENIVELLKVGNLKIQDNFRTERNKVLDLRKANKIFKKQLQLTECYRIQSLQFMSHLMLYYRGLVKDETLANFEFHLRNISSFGSITEYMVQDNETEKRFAEHQELVVKFYSVVAKESFLDQVVTKHVSYMRSNNFLSNQLSSSKKQIADYEEYANRLLQEIETSKKNNEKNQKKIAHLKGELSQSTR